MFFSAFFGFLLSGLFFFLFFFLFFLSQISCPLPILFFDFFVLFVLLALILDNTISTLLSSHGLPVLLNWFGDFCGHFCGLNGNSIQQFVIFASHWWCLLFLILSNLAGENSPTRCLGMKNQNTILCTFLSKESKV